MVAADAAVRLAAASECGADAPGAGHAAPPAARQLRRLGRVGAGGARATPARPQHSLTLTTSATTTLHRSIM